jgi:3-hydroxyisobutyrate dehydrogenase-like beta-hydroxyacid dehydrogenase
MSKVSVPGAGVSRIRLYDPARKNRWEKTMAKVAFLGLGVMGFPMAGHLAAKGHDVVVYNRTFAKAEAWTQKHKGTAKRTPKEAAAGREIVFCCVGNDEHLRAVVLGDSGAFAGMSQGTILVDNTTASADIAREFHAEGKKHGIDFIDAPVSGGQAGAESGQLTVMCGGEAAPFERAKPVADAYAKAVTLIGPPGAGQITKMMNQMAIAGLVQGLAEALNLGQRCGIDMDKAMSAISKGAAQSWQMDNRWQNMVAGKFDYGFAVDWMRKDLGIAMAEGKRVKAQMPVVALVDQFYARVQERGGGRWDTSSLIQPLQKP